MRTLHVKYDITALENGKVQRGEMVPLGLANKTLCALHDIDQLKGPEVKTFMIGLEAYLRSAHSKDTFNGNLTLFNSMFKISNITFSFFDQHPVGLKVSCGVKHKDMADVKQLEFTIPVGSGLFEAKTCTAQLVRDKIFVALCSLLHFPVPLSQSELFRSCFELIDLEWQQVEVPTKPLFDFKTLDLSNQ